MLGQNFTASEIDRLLDFNIDSKFINLDNDIVQDDMKKILKLERKRSFNKKMAIGYTSAGALGVALGSFLLLRKKPKVSPGQTDDGAAMGDIVGGIMVFTGTLTGLMSIPYWYGASKRKKQRNYLIDFYD